MLLGVACMLLLGQDCMKHPGNTYCPVGWWHLTSTAQTHAER